MSLNHPDPAIRMLAVKEIVKRVQSQVCIVLASGILHLYSVVFTLEVYSTVMNMK